MRKIILHIGSPKCGSTFLQCVMLNNTQTLAKHRVLYPDGSGHHPGNGADIAQMTQLDFDRLFEKSDTIILSHEDLFLAPQRGETLSRLAKACGAIVQVVIFMRPFSQFIFGDYSQFMKQNFEAFLKTRSPYGGRSFEQFTVDRAHTLKPVPSFKAWQRLFPETPVMINSHRNIRPVFEDLLGVSDMDWVVHHDRTNPSLRMEDCEDIAAAMADATLSDGEIRRMLKDAFKKTKEHDSGKSEERIAWVEATFSKQNQHIMETFSFDNFLK